MINTDIIIFLGNHEQSIGAPTGRHWPPKPSQLILLFKFNYGSHYIVISTLVKQHFADFMKTPCNVNC